MGWPFDDIAAAASHAGKAISSTVDPDGHCGAALNNVSSTLDPHGHCGAAIERAKSAVSNCDFEPMWDLAKQMERDVSGFNGKILQGMAQGVQDISEHNPSFRNDISDAMNGLNDQLHYVLTEAQDLDPTGGLKMINDAIASTLTELEQRFCMSIYREKNLCDPEDWNRRQGEDDIQTTISFVRWLCDGQYRARDSIKLFRAQRANWKIVNNDGKNNVAFGFDQASELEPQDFIFTYAAMCMKNQHEKSRFDSTVEAAEWVLKMKHEHGQEDYPEAINNRTKEWKDIHSIYLSDVTTRRYVPMSWLSGTNKVHEIIFSAGEDTHQLNGTYKWEHGEFTQVANP
jgi:hypothetical protein